MKKLVLLVFFSTFFAFAQDEEIVTKESFDDYNQWFIEFGIGGNKAARTHTGAQEQFFSASPTSDFINTKFFSGIHADLAVRYMFNDKFGLRFKGGFNDISEDEDKSTQSFNSTYFQSSLETVFNLGSVLDFQNWTQKFNLQFYTGIGAGLLLPDDDFVDDEDLVFSAVAGITPMYKISDRVSLTLDIMGIVNFDQQYNWDGISNATTRAVDGLMLNYSLGLNIALGKSKRNIDWYHVYNNDVTELALLRQEVNAIKEKLVDSDQDGVLDFLDREPKTVNGVEVNTKGIAVDRNMNGIPDELESYVNNNLVTKTELEESKKEFANEVFRELLTNGFINVYFGFDSVIPEGASINDINSVVLFLKQKPNERIELVGYTDAIGNKAYNEKLSLRRAEYVKDIITSAGIDESRIDFKGSGVNPNIESNTDYSRSLARKVMIKLK